jgi:predicted O-methyltransferase YrrM
MFYAPEQSRGWQVLPVFDQDAALMETLGIMAQDNEAAGQSDVGIRNLMYCYALSLRPRRVLEIGTHIGTGAAVISSALKRNGYGKLITVDPNDRVATKAKNYLSQAGLSEFCEVVRGFSYEENVKSRLETEAPFDLIFIDGAHEYEAALHDIEYAGKILHPNGIMFLHDVGRMSSDFDKSGKGGVRKALYDFSQANSIFRTVYFEHPLWLNPCGAAMVCRQEYEPEIQ